MPDDSIFETVAFDYKVILDHLRHQAYLTKIHTNIYDERTNEKYGSILKVAYVLTPSTLI